MITNNIFVKYHTLDSRKDVENFINEGTPILSNHSKWKEMAEKLMTYKDENKKEYKTRENGLKYRNIYAHYICTLIPYEVEMDKWDEFVEAYVQQISSSYQSRLLWIAKYFTIGKANYAEIVCFTRYVYKKEHYQTQVYNQDWYFNHKGQRCTKDADGAVLRAVKGAVKFDKQGNPIKKKVSVKNVEERIFIYKNFDSFINKLKVKYMKVLKSMAGIKGRINKVISRVTVKETDTESIRKQKLFRNQKIANINTTLKEYQDGINDGNFYSTVDDIYKEFHQLLEDVDEMIHRTNAKFSRIEKKIQTWWIETVAGDFLEME